MIGGMSMAEKDLVERVLEDYDDVFADIINAFVFNGKKVIDPRYLQNGRNESIYKAGGKIQGQRRDVLKYYIKDGKILAAFGIENQTNIDCRMPYRIIGYDGAEYTEQVHKKKYNYPVITVVLYFGNKRWKKNKSLSKRYNLSCFDDNIRKYLQDYSIMAIEVCNLTEKQINLLTSDFKIIADFMVQRKNKGADFEYKILDKEIVHLNSFLDMMSIFLNDNRYRDLVDQLNKKKEKDGRVGMDYAYESILNKGKCEGKKEGIKTGLNAMISENIAEHKPMEVIIDKLMRFFFLSKEDAEKYYSEYKEKNV